MKIVLLGAPASGKGTLAQKITKQFDFEHVSPGDLLRENISNGTALGVEAQKYMNVGMLVPDDIVCGLIKDKIESTDETKNLIFDGFPRTLKQALFLDDVCKIDLVVNLDVDDEVAIERTIGRRICPNCKQIYNTKSHKSATCDNCGTALIQRKDDTADSMKTRLKIYHEQINPLIDYYKSNNYFIVLNGNKDVNDLSFLNIEGKR